MDKRERVEKIDALQKELKNLREQQRQIMEQLETNGKNMTPDELENLKAINRDMRQQLIDIGKAALEIVDDEPIVSGAIKALTDKIATELESSALDEAPTLDGEVPDPLEQTRQVFEEVERKHKRGHAQVLEQMLPHLEKSLHREYPEVDKYTAEIIGVTMSPPSELDDGRSMVLPVEVSHLKTIDNDALHELLMHDDAPTEFARVFTSPYIGLIVWGNLRRYENDEPTDEKLDCKTLLVIHPLGIDQFTRTHDGTTWSEPDHTRLIDGTKPDNELEQEVEQLSAGELGKMPAMLAYFYAKVRLAVGDIDN